MSQKTKRRAGRGTLHIVAGLLVASALVRIATHTGAALAEEQQDASKTPVVAEQAVETDALLAAFQAREARLAEGETQLRNRLQALRVAEMEIEEKLEALRAAEQALSATIAQADSASANDLTMLATVYENMKPKEAAALFAEMPPAFAAGFLGMMRPEAAALVMTELPPETAYSFSVVLAGRNANVPTQ